MKASVPPLAVESAASAVTGKSVDPVAPVSHALPAASRATPAAPSLPVRPSAVENTAAEPAGFTFVRNASLPSDEVSSAPGVVGKSVDPAPPETYAFPAASTASPAPVSKPDPPRYVE